LNSIRFTDVNNGVAVGDSGTILHTTNGGTTWLKPARATASELFCVRSLTSTTLIAVGGTTFNGVIVRSTDGGSTWATTASPVAYPIHGLSFLDSLNGWLCAGNGNIFHTTDGGQTWINQPSGIEEVAGTAQVFNTLLIESATTGYVGGTGGLTMKTTNGGAPIGGKTSWLPVPGGPIQIACVDGVGEDGHRSIVFVGLPLHYLNGNSSNANPAPYAVFFNLALHTLLGL
jgi:photosystem II stability/assembly factor-like uncharacterized protein